MSSRRRSQYSSVAEDEINGLISKLRAEINQRGSTKASTSRLLKETCKRIKSLSKEIDNLSERISELIALPETGSAEADILRNLLQH